MSLILHVRCRSFLASFAIALIAVAFIAGCGNDAPDEGQAADNSADSSTLVVPALTGNALAPPSSEDPPIPPQADTPTGTTESQQTTAGATVTSGPLEPETPPSEPQTATPKDEVYSAIDDAIRRLQAKDYPGFIKYYMRIEEIRRLRDKEAMKQMLAQIERNPELFESVADFLVKARQAPPEFNETFTEATLRIVAKAEDGNLADTAKNVTAPKTTDVKLTGFGADLDIAIGKALAALEEGDVESFVASMFPAGELRHPDADKRRAQVVGRMKANPAPIQQMIADLKAIKGKTPMMEAEGSVATFELAGETIDVGRNKVTLPTRTFKFQKVEDSWRLFDNTTATRKEVARQAKLPLPKFSPQGGTFVKLEKIGDAWRIQVLNF